MNQSYKNELPLSATLTKYPYARLFQNTLIGFFAIGIAVALLTPEDILDYAIADNFVEVMKFIPYVENSAKHSPLPEVASFFAAAMWSLTPVVFALFWQGTRHVYSVTSNELKLWQGLKYMVMLLILVIMLLGMFDFSSGSRIGLLATSSRLGIGILGTLRIISVPFFLAVLIMAIRNWRFLFYGDLELLKK